MKVTFNGLGAKRDIQGIVIGPDRRGIAVAVSIKTTADLDASGQPLVCLEIGSTAGVYVRAEDLAGAALGVARCAKGGE